MEGPDEPRGTAATLPVTRSVQARILAQLESALPEATSAMLIGGTLMLQRGMHPAGLTKDTDVVLLVHRDGDFDIPDAEQVAAIMERFAEDVHVRKDRTSVAGHVVLPEGRFLVELVRGRGPRGGYFVRRTLLKAVAAASEPQNRLLLPPLEALAVLKAWAATDQDKLAATGRDVQGLHAARAADFRRDVRVCLQALLDARKVPDTALVRSLLDRCGEDRRARIHAVMVEQGWPLEQE